MARLQHEPEINKYIDHYSMQIGGNIPFVGHYRQMGYGLGALLSGLGRMLIRPLAKQSVKAVVKSAAKTGARTLLSKPAQKAIKEAAKQGVKRVLKRGAEEALSTGVGILSDVVKKKRNLKDATKVRGKQKIQQLLKESVKASKPAHKRGRPVRRTGAKRRKLDILD